MAFLNQLRQYFQHLVDCFNCGLNGHGNVVVLERYEPSYREKIFRGSSLKNLLLVNRYVESKWVEKCACRTCGETFLRKRTGRL